MDLWSNIHIQRLTARNRGYLDIVINGSGGQIATPRRWGTTTDSIKTLSGTGIGTRKFKITTFTVGFSKGVFRILCRYSELSGVDPGTGGCFISRPDHLPTSGCRYETASSINEHVQISSIPWSQPLDVNFRRRALFHSLWAFMVFPLSNNGICWIDHEKGFP